MTPFQKIEVVRKLQGVTAPQKLILLTITTHLGEKDFCFLSLSTLQLECCLARDNLSRNLKKLISLGLLIKIPPSDGYKSNRFTINFEKIINDCATVVAAHYHKLCANAQTVAQDNPICANPEEIAQQVVVQHYQPYANAQDIAQVVVENNPLCANVDENGHKLVVKHYQSSSEALLDQERSTTSGVVEHYPKRKLNNSERTIKLLRTAHFTNAQNRFAEFWNVYPRKRDRKRSEQTWEKQKLDTHADIIIADVIKRLTNDQGWKVKQFIPYPNTYLKGERWEDEITPLIKSENYKPIAATPLAPVTNQSTSVDPSRPTREPKGSPLLEEYMEKMGIRH